MNDDARPPVRVDLARWDGAAPPALAAGDALHLDVPMPSHGSSGHAWDLLHDIACAVWLIRALAPHARLVDADLSEGHLAVALSLVLDLVDPVGVRAALTQAHPLWSDDDALDAEREAIDCDVLDLIAEVGPDDLGDLPPWLAAHYIRWRETAREVASQG